MYIPGGRDALLEASEKLVVPEAIQVPTQADAPSNQLAAAIKEQSTALMALVNQQLASQKDVDPPQPVEVGPSQGAADVEASYGSQPEQATEYHRSGDDLPAQGEEDATWQWNQSPAHLRRNYGIGDVGGCGSEGSRCLAQPHRPPPGLLRPSLYQCGSVRLRLASHGTPRARMGFAAKSTEAAFAAVQRSTPAFLDFDQPELREGRGLQGDKAQHGFSRSCGSSEFHRATRSQGEGKEQTPQPLRQGQEGRGEGRVKRNVACSEQPDGRPSPLPHCSKNGSVSPSSKPSSTRTSTSKLIPLKILKECLGLDYSSRTGFGSFLGSSLKPNTTTAQLSSSCSSDLMPCPIPELLTFESGRTGRLSNQRRRHLEKQRTIDKVVQVIIAVLNWEAVGFPTWIPRECVLGRALSSAQRRMVSRIRDSVEDFVSIDEGTLKDLSRSADKFRSLLSFSTVQPTNIEAYVKDMTALLESPLLRFDSYGACRTSSFETRRSDSPLGRSRNAQFKPKDYKHADSNICNITEQQAAAYKSISGSSSVFTPVKADRLKWKHSSTFDPLPYFEDKLLRSAFLDPDTLRKPQEEWPVRPKAKVRACKPELLKLGEKVDAKGALTMFDSRDCDRHELCGTFAVGKDDDFDRLIPNPTVVNSRQYSINRSTKTLATGA